HAEVVFIRTRRDIESGDLYKPRAGDGLVYDRYLGSIEVSAVGILITVRINKGHVDVARRVHAPIVTKSQSKFGGRHTGRDCYRHNDSIIGDVSWRYCALGR